MFRRWSRVVESWVFRSEMRVRRVEVVYSLTAWASVLAIDRCAG